MPWILLYSVSEISLNPYNLLTASFQIFIIDFSVKFIGYIRCRIKRALHILANIVQVIFYAEYLLVSTSELLDSNTIILCFSCSNTLWSDIFFKVSEKLSSSCLIFFHFYS